jgi:two-component sensor histidine kinase
MPGLVRFTTTRPWVLTVAVSALLWMLTIALWLAVVRVQGSAGGHGAAWILVTVMALSVLASVAIWRALRGGTRASEEARRNLLAMESLNQISTAISGQLGAGFHVLDQLADAAARLLGMSRAGVCMVDPTNTTLEIIASAGDMPPNFPKVFRLDALPLCSRCLATEMPIIEGDIRLCAESYDLPTVQAFNAVSLILIPFDVENRGVGLLTLSSSEPKSFTEFDRKIAQMLGTQASVILSNAQLYERTRAALEMRTRVLKQREALALAIQSSDTIENSLGQIVRLIPPALGTDLCGLTLITGNNGERVLAAVTPPFEHFTGMTLSPNPLAETVFHTRQTLTVPDVALEPGVHPAWRHAPNISSILYVPMFNSNRLPLGILALARNQKGTFSQEQIELAQTFAALAAVAVENARLLEQTRQDTDTKTLLLRELNHRVKNNLTGIVALLTMNQPAMPAEVRTWLDRATDRIRTMAGAHELIFDQTSNVSLVDLVSRTLSALSVATRSDVSVVLDLEGVGASLDTEKAVGLAMVLHELCYNAIVHGLKDGGTLTIRGRNVADDTPASTQPGDADIKSIVRLEIMDDGAGCCPAGNELIDCAQSKREPTGTAQGLELVKGLVRRELRGQFSLRPRAEGGTVATVWFPVAGIQTRRTAP